MKIKRLFSAFAAALILLLALAPAVFAESSDITGSADPSAEESFAPTAENDYRLENMKERTFISYSTGYELRYRIYHSLTYDDMDYERPASLIVYFHGDDGKGSDNKAQIAGKSLLDAMVSEETEPSFIEYQYIVIAPQCPEGESFVAENDGSDDVQTEIMNAVFELALEIEATEIVLDKFIVMGMGTGASAAIEYAGNNVERTSRLVTVGGECDPVKAAQIYDAGVDFLMFAEEGNASMTALDERIKALNGGSSPVRFAGGSLDECLDYALSFDGPSVGYWSIVDSYMSRYFNVSAICNSDGGTISASPATVRYDGSAEIILTLNAGYLISNVSINGIENEPTFFVKSADNEKVYIGKLQNVQSNLTVNVELTRYTTESKKSGKIDKLMLVLSIASAVLIVAAAVTYKVSHDRAKK